MLTSERLRGLLAAVVALSSDLTLDGVLQRIVDSASELVGARYGFLGVLDGRSERRLGTFAVHGLDDAHQEMIGRLPQGEGLLGLVIDHPEPLRIAHLDDHPSRAGFPRLHPDMTSFLGVPIRVHDRVFGNLYLTEKDDGEGFTSEDEEIAVALASAAGVVIENARLWEQGEYQRRWLLSAAEITTALLQPITRADAVQLVVDRARTASAADVVVLVMPDEDGRLVARGLSGLPAELVGQSIGLTTLVADALGSDSGVVVPDVGLDALYALETVPDWPALSSLQAVPLPGLDGDGVLLLGWGVATTAPAWSLDLELPSSFAQHASLVMQVVRAQEDRARLAVFEDRDRIGRDLHDLVIQRIFAIGLALDHTSRMAEAETVRTRLSAAVDDLDQTIKDVRRTIFDLNTPLNPADLRSDIESIVGDAQRLLSFRPVLDVRGPVSTEVPGIVAENLLLVLHETLSNIVRHAEATQVSIEVDCTGDDVLLVVSDDGLGLQGSTLGSGLRNMRHRAANLGGTCRFEPGPGRGLQVRWQVPKEM
ncbi:GAF domain-containing sensor histidine kinase [Aeromicrobium sp. Root495]|uniref:GAF domain-containing sensor histidine kinase n=1 Tax=Aeromicrobium sp. Root495 TaxID=1736550 RepID=UPI000A7081F0|nr:GAF domain-containing protein [Aeromicrobium sp. Root495]